VARDTPKRSISFSIDSLLASSAFAGVCSGYVQKVVVA
jgi:hypothetical protein